LVWSDETFRILEDDRSVNSTHDLLRAHASRRFEFRPAKCQKQPEPNFPFATSRMCCANTMEATQAFM
jgi:hypothetical protein